ncbi:MAG: hypothetical protein Q9216_002745 [Gyalolechia sp. 2 TL-2023]
MSSNVLCPSRTNGSTTALRRSTGVYRWSRRYRWTLDPYSRSLKYHESAKRLGPSDMGYIALSRTGQNPGSFHHRILPHRGWRLSSSWGRWKYHWDDFERKHQSKNRNQGEDPVSLFRTFDRLEKDSEAMYRLLKKRIEADPFDALFGRSFLYPAQATWWNAGHGSQDPKAEQRRSNSEPGPQENAKADGEHLSKGETHASASKDNTTGQQTAYSSGAKSASDVEVDSHSFVIDPITMRKVPRQPSNKTSEVAPHREKSEPSFDISVKLFERNNRQQPKSKPLKDKAAIESENKEVQAQVTDHRSAGDRVAHEPLAQEGRPREHDSPTAPFNGPTVLKARFPENNIRTPSKLSSSPDSAGERSGLSYDAKENKADDVDLLRASDIRASSGLRGRPRRETEVQKDERRQSLETRFKQVSESDLGWQDQKAFQMERAQNAKAREREELEKAYLEREKLAQKAAMEAMEIREAEAPTSNVHTPATQPEQAEGDMATNVHEFASRGRWYKRKAPHATQLEQQKAIQLAKDRAFIQEIRGIYEDTYGTIDTKHRQPGIAASQTGSQKPAENTTSAQLLTRKNDFDESRNKESKNTPDTSGPLSMQERIGTLLQQLLDDLRYLQKLLRKPESTSDIREELFHRNRSIRNASDAITEALSSSSPKSNGSLPMQAARSVNQTAMNETQKISKPELLSTQPPKPSTVYCVLAYDPSNQQVATAEMSMASESPSERRLSLSEALSSLTEPAKFLPHLTSLQSQGFELVSSDTNILVLRKIPRASTAYSHHSLPCTEKPRIDRPKGRKNINPIDGTTTQTGNFASPTGFVNHDSVLLPSGFEKEDTEQNASGYKVHRKEDVFSGPREKQWENSRFDDGSDTTKRKGSYRRSNRRRRTTKRMVWVGLWTAGCCYAVGAITEYLRA